MGTIATYRGKRGTTYRLRVEVARDPGTGARRWRTGSFGTKKEAEAADRAWEAAARYGGIVASTRLLGPYLREWLDGSAVRDNTWIRHDQDVRLRIVPHLGALPLKDLDAPTIQRWVRAITKAFAPATVARSHAVLHGALTQAVAWRLLPANPCVGIVLPRDAHTEMRVWDEGQVRRFLAATADCPYAALWRLAVLVGLRKGEILVLEWRDLDLPRRRLHVRRTLTRDRDKRFIVGPPKTQAGTRTITLPRTVATSLARHRARFPRPPRAEEPLFPGGHGARHIDPNLPNRMLDRYRDAINEAAGEAVLPRLRFHDLRHTAATLALVQGVSPRVVQERLGHASLAVTLGLYSHVTLTMQDEAADKMDAMFADEVEDLDAVADDD